MIRTPTPHQSSQGSPGVFSEPNSLKQNVGGLLIWNAGIVVYFCYIGNERNIEIIMKGVIGYIENNFCDFPEKNRCNK